MTETVELKAIPVFRTGQYPQGEFDEAFLQQLADSYDPTFHEAPNYLAHNDDAATSNLAFGWIKRLFVKGDTLLADFANVPRRFAELVLAGRIKKRSVEIYGDLAGKGPYVRAVAWPLIPEVKALADVHPTQVFHDDSHFHTIVFEEKEIDMTDQTTYVTREEMELMLRQVKDDLADEQRRRAADMQVAGFCEQMVACGKMTPAERTTEQPLLTEQARRELAMTFAEGDTPLSEQRMDYYRRRRPVIELDAAAATTTPPDPDRQKLVRYFHENREFFSRLGVTLDDLAEADKYETTHANPLTN